MGVVKMFISLEIQNPGLQLYPHNKMFHKWNVDLETEYSSSVSKFQTQKRQEGPFMWPIQSNIAPPNSTKNTSCILERKTMCLDHTVQVELR